MNQDLINIKKYYGEEMMHLCRRLFPSLLEREGLLFDLITTNFAYSKFLYSDIINNNLVNKFKDYIYSLVDLETKHVKTTKPLSDLMQEAGYNLYQCKTEEDIQSFKKYYKLNEQLCTFKGGRLDNYYVFFAVKKNIDEIKRESFSTPKRQDEYGTSVISIQFTKGKVNTLSIKNRYNHTVDNPDATFSNNLENIIPGLTNSFEKEYNLHINQNGNNNFEIPNYVKASDGKYYKYNYEINNIYYCPNNIIIDNFKVINNYKEKEKYLIIDYFIIDLVTKSITLYDKKIADSFVNSFNNIKLIEILKLKENNHKKIGIVLENNKRIYIEVDKLNRMLYYEDNDIQVVNSDFLYRNLYLQEISLSNVIEVKSNFLWYNECLKKLNIPNVELIGNSFAHKNENLKDIVLPNVKKIEAGFLYNNRVLQKFIAPNLISLGPYSLIFISDLQESELSSLREVGIFSLVYKKK